MSATEVAMLLESLSKIEDGSLFLIISQHDFLDSVVYKKVKTIGDVMLIRDTATGNQDEVGGDRKVFKLSCDINNIID